MYLLSHDPCNLIIMNDSWTTQMKLEVHNASLICIKIIDSLYSKIEIPIFSSSNSIKMGTSKWIEDEIKVEN